MRSRAFRPERFVLDRGDEHYRGAMIASIVGATTTIRLYQEASIVGTLTCSTTLVPAGARTIGCPVCLKVSGGFPYVIAEVLESTYAWQDAPRGDAAAAVAAGRFCPGIVPRAIHGEPSTWWEV